MPETIAFLALNRLRCWEPKRGTNARIGVVLGPRAAMQSKLIEVADWRSQGWKLDLPNIYPNDVSGPEPIDTQSQWIRWDVDNRDENLDRLVRVTVSWTSAHSAAIDSSQFAIHPPPWPPLFLTVDEYHKIEVEIANNFWCGPPWPSDQHLVAGVLLSTAKDVFVAKQMRESEGPWVNELPGLDLSWSSFAAPEPTVPGYRLWALSVTNRDPVRARTIALSAVTFK